MSLETVDIELSAGGRGHIRVGDKELDNVHGLYIRAASGEVPEIELQCFAHPLKVQIEGEVTIVDSDAVLDKVRQFHEAWGEKDGDDLDLLALWEDLGKILGSVS